MTAEGFMRLALEQAAAALEAGDLVAQPPARFGQVGDAHGFETVAAELSGAGGEARREVGCFVLHD